VGAVCGNSACTDLSGGRSAMAVPTALRSEPYRSRRGVCIAAAVKLSRMVGRWPSPSSLLTAFAQAPTLNDGVKQRRIPNLSKLRFHFAFTETAGIHPYKPARPATPRCNQALTYLDNRCPGHPLTSCRIDKHVRLGALNSRSVAMLALFQIGNSPPPSIPFGYPSTNTSSPMARSMSGIVSMVLTVRTSPLGGI
jgi:hypothetical protein